jgi:hypothetical protein
LNIGCELWFTNQRIGFEASLPGKDARDGSAVARLNFSGVCRGLLTDDQAILSAKEILEVTFF